MKQQRGSALAGVLGLGLVMTLAASGFLMIAGNAGKNDIWVLEEARLRNAAESGINLGARWMRCHDSLYFASNAIELPITTSGDNFATMDGYRVRVRLLPNPSGFRILESLATKGTGFDSCRISWLVDSVKPSYSGLASDVYLSTWQETQVPAN